MTGDLYINEKDAWTTWGVSMGVGFLENLLTPPPLKEFVENKSRLQPGKEVIHNSPMWDERDLNLSIRIEGTTQEEYLQRYAAFTSEFQKGLLVFRVPVIKSTYKLTYKGASKLSLNIGRTFSEITFKFNEPDPSDRK